MSYSYNRLVKKYMPNSSGTDLYDVDYIYGSYGDCGTPPRETIPQIP